MKHFAPALLAALAAVALPAAARADKIDKLLNENMEAVKTKLQDKGYKNVGVLRFRVQVGKKAASFDNSLYNGNLPHRIENLLIMNGGEDNPAVGVIRDAGGAAMASKITDWFGDESQRKQLFDVDYNLAWAGKSVKADAFLTGCVSVSEDFKTTRLVLTCFDKKNLEPTELLSVKTETDRDVIRDLGLSFVLNRKAREALATKCTPEDVDRSVLAALDVGVDSSDLAGLEVTVLADDKAIPFKAVKNGEGPSWQMECPATDKRVTVRVRNTTDKKLGVVLKLNGVSLFMQQTRSSDNCQKWLIEGGKSITLKGFYAPENEKRLSVKPFKILVGDEAKKAKEQLGDRAGLLEIDVFAQGGEGEEVLELSARGLPPSKEREKEKEDKAQSYKSVRASLMKDARLKTQTTVNSKVVIVPDVEAIKADKFKTKDFESHVVGRLAVKIVPAS